MARKIFDIDVDEITLCESASNRKKFFIKKMEVKVDDLIKELEKFLAEDEDDEGILNEEQITKAKELPEKAMEAIKGALNILNKYKDDMPDDVLSAIKTLAKYAAYGYPEKKADLEKSGAKLSKATRDQLLKIYEAIKGAPDALNSLKEMLGQEVEKSKGIEGEKLSVETLAKLEKLEELEKVEKQRLEQDLAEKNKKAVEKLIEDKFEAFGLKKKAVKKSIDGQDADAGNDDKGDDKEDKWPSLYIPGLND